MRRFLDDGKAAAIMRLALLGALCACLAGPLLFDLNQMTVLTSSSPCWSWR